MNVNLTIVFKVIVLLIAIIVCLDFNNSIIFTKNALSKMHIAFIFLFVIIITFKYDLIKNKIESKSKFKYAFCVAYIILFFTVINAIYSFLPNFLNIQNWYLTEYTNSEEMFLDFIFLPKYYNTLNVKKITIYESIFSIGFILLSYLKEKIQCGKTAYIIEQILKLFSKFTFVILFFISIYTVPNKFLTVRTVKYVGTGIAFIVSLLFILKNYLALKGCTKHNKHKYGKENLVIVLTTYNYKFKLHDKFINPLIIFNKFDNQNLVKSLLVDGKKYSFVSYDAIRHKLIDIKKYKNIAYLIDLRQDVTKVLSDEEEIEIEKIINSIIKENKNFIVHYKSKAIIPSKLVERLKKEYPFRFKEQLDLKNILDMVVMKENADRLKSNSKKLLDYINNMEKTSEEKNTYIKYGLNVVLDSFNYTEYFYTLLKISEYIIHYMALKNIIDNPGKMSEENVKNGTLAAWRSCISFDKQYLYKNTEKIENIASQKDIIDSIIRIREILNVTQKDTKDAYYFKDDICKVVAEVRNIIAAHGVITYSVSEKIVEDLFNIVFILVKEFEELDITIKDDEKIKYIFDKEISAIYKNDNEIFLYSNTVTEKRKEKKLVDGVEKEIEKTVDLYKESLNYETGKRKVIDKKISLKADNIYTVEEIEEQLKKWVIK